MVSAPRTERDAIRQRMMLALFAVALLAPFVNKAYHMDDTLFLRVADRIRVAPWDPFGFTYNWHVQPEPMAEITQNPPLGGYLLAVIQAAAGRSEWAAHVVYISIAAGCVVLMHALAARFCRHPATATAAVAVAPGFLVTATNVMADVPLLALWLLAVYLVVRAAETNRPAGLWCAGLAAAACAMTKYFGVALVPLLIVYWLMKSRRWSWHLAGLLLPVAVLALWGMYTLQQYGMFHPLQAAAFSVEDRASAAVANQSLHTLAFAGGILIWPLALLVRWSSLAPWLRILSYVAVAAATVDIWFQTDLLANWSTFNVFTTVLFTLMSLTGLIVVAAAADACCRHFDADTTLLSLWLFGTLIFSALVNWSVNARILLPALLPATVLAIRWLESPASDLSNDSDRRVLLVRVALVPTCLLSVALAFTDYRLAGAGRSFAHTTVRQLLAEDRPVYFIGHLGIQYYAEDLGAEPLDLQNPQATPGDVLVRPADSVQTYLHGVLTRPTRQVTFHSPLGLHTQNFEAHAGFYTFYTGPLPFNIAPRIPLVEYRVGRIASGE